jgi:hypothetical protein
MSRLATSLGVRCAIVVAAVAAWTIVSPPVAGQTTGQRGTPPKPAQTKPGTAKPPATKGKPAPPPDPRTVVAELQKRATVDSQHYEGTLRVTDAGGKISEKRWIYDRLGSAGAAKAIIRFTEPAEVKGVALLIFNYPDRASDQWMWTPSISRDRRIATQDRGTRFFGTDFSFEDLEERDVARYDYKLLGEETIEASPCWKIESTPRASVRSQYTRSILWIRKDSYTYAQIDNFTEAKAIRRLNYRDLATVQGVATSRTIEVHDLTRNSRTNLKLEALKYNVPLKEAQFTLEALRRG